MKLTLFLVLVFMPGVFLSSGMADRNETQTPLTQHVETKTPKAKPERCLSARTGVSFYRSATHTWQLLRGAEKLAGPAPRVRGKSCQWARYAVGVWIERTQAAKRSYRRWLRERTLRDFTFKPDYPAWRNAVEEVQRVFPGTEGWLLSCSAAEGGHGRWVGYGGQDYSTWLRDSDTVGGPLQFRWSTFKGMYRHGLEYVLGRGFRVPEHLKDPDNDVTWRSALGQAIAGGWARYTGNDNSHWSASWGRGC